MGMEADSIKKYIEIAVVKEQIIRSKAIAVVVENATALKPEVKEEEKKSAKKTKKADESEEGAAE